MPKRSSIGKRRSKALPALGFAGMSLSMASGACASTSEASANTSPPSQKHEIFLGEEEISDVSLATFYVFDKENAGPPPLFQKLRLAAGCGAGCGCSFGCAYWPQPPLQRQRSRHSIERRSLRTARTEWRPAQPPQSSSTRQAYNVLESSPSKSNSCLLVAQTGPVGMVRRCPLIGEDRKWRFGAVRTVFEPVAEVGARERYPLCRAPQ